MSMPRTADHQRLDPGGEVVLPKAICEALQSEVGTRLVVEIIPEGVVLKPAAAFAESLFADVPGCLTFRVVPRTPAETEARVFAGTERHNAHG